MFRGTHRWAELNIIGSNPSETPNPWNGYADSSRTRTTKPGSNEPREAWHLWRKHWHAIIIASLQFVPGHAPSQEETRTSSLRTRIVQSNTLSPEETMDLTISRGINPSPMYMFHFDLNPRFCWETLSFEHRSAFCRYPYCVVYIRSKRSATARSPNPVGPRWKEGQI